MKIHIGKRLYGLMYRLSIFLVGFLFGLFGYVVTRSISFPSVISGNSMDPILQNGDYTAGVRIDILKPELKRGDIISFYPPVYDHGHVYTKRIIGLPGETVIIKDGEIYIDGSLEPLEELYVTNDWTVKTGPYYFEIPDGHYLVLGDNRNVSYDSREWKKPYVDYNMIQSKTNFLYWPLSRFQCLW